MTGRGEIDDGETSMTECDSGGWINPATGVIGTAVREPICHRADNFGSPVVAEGRRSIEAGDPTHELASPEDKFVAAEADHIVQKAHSPSGLVLRQGADRHKVTQHVRLLDDVGGNAGEPDTISKRRTEQSRSIIVGLLDAPPAVRLPALVVLNGDEQSAVRGYSIDCLLKRHPHCAGMVEDAPGIDDLELPERMDEVVIEHGTVVDSPSVMSDKNRAQLTPNSNRSP